MMEYEVQRRNRKTIGLSIERDGALVVKAPFFVSRTEIEAVVKRKEDWIYRKREEIILNKEKYPTITYIDGQRVFYLGKPYEIVGNGDKDTVFLSKDKIVLPAKHVDRQWALKEWYILQANIELSRRVAHFEIVTGLKAVSIKITNARRQWGSCSADKNIHFPWRLVMCPPDIIDYVVLHEMIHLIYLNHSKDFYREMERYMPDYRQRKRWLAENRYIIGMID